MMIDASLLTFTRICVHTIEKKLMGSEHATALPETSLTKLGPEVEDTLKDRIKTAFAHKSRSLELELAKSAVVPGSFFDLSKDIRGTDDKEFISRTSEMTKLLAKAQTSTQIPGGYLIVIDALDEFAKPVVIAIKAELNEGLLSDKSSGVNTIEIIKDIFLSKGTKLYKIAALYKADNIGKEYPNDEWGCLLYDEQFSPGERPSTYFWEGFLKFSIDNNAKVQTALLYNTVTNFITKSDMPVEVKNKALEGLETLVVDTHAQILDPETIKVTLFAPEHQAEFDLKVRPKFPRSIVKDTSGIERKLETQNVYFSNGVKLTGDKKIFSKIVTEIKNPEELENLELSPYKTILVIEGKPSKTKPVKAKPGKPKTSKIKQ